MDSVKEVKKQPPRSVTLTAEQLKWLKKYRSRFETETDCAIDLLLDRNVLARVIAFGSGSEKTINKILRKKELVESNI
jgi:hypothetical protein